MALNRRQKLGLGTLTAVLAASIVAATVGVAALIDGGSDVGAVEQAEPEGIDFEQWEADLASLPGGGPTAFRMIKRDWVNNVCPKPDAKFRYYVAYFYSDGPEGMAVAAINARHACPEREAVVESLESWRRELEIYEGHSVPEFETVVEVMAEYCAEPPGESYLPAVMVDRGDLEMFRINVSYACPEKLPEVDVLR